MQNPYIKKKTPENPETVIDEDCSFKLSFLKTFQLKTKCSCPGLQKYHVKCIAMFNPSSFDVNGSGIARSNNTVSSTKNSDTGVQSAFWTQQLLI